MRAQLNQNLKTVSVTAYHSLVYPFTHEERKAIAVIHANEIQNKVTETTYFTKTKTNERTLMQMSYIF